MSKKLIVRHLDNIIPMPTSHSIGEKKILLANDETDSAITQIAKTILHKGDKVEEHVHLTMDEHYLFISGKANLYIDEIKIECKQDLYVFVPFQKKHHIEAISDTEFITIGVATN